MRPLVLVFLAFAIAISKQAIDDSDEIPCFVQCQLRNECICQTNYPIDMFHVAYFVAKLTFVQQIPVAELQQK